MKESQPKPDYLYHDQAYQAKRNAGFPGWDTEDVIQQSICELSSLLDKIPLSDSSNVLDIGCGAGNLSFWLESRGFRVCGTDISHQAIEWAKEKGELQSSKVSFITSDATKYLPYPNNFFDIVIDNHCLHCIIGEDRNSYLRHIVSVLKPGGFYLLSSMCCEFPYPEGLEGFDTNSKCIFCKGFPVRYLGTRKEILSELENASLQIIEHTEQIGQDRMNDLIVIAQKVE